MERKSHRTAPTPTSRAVERKHSPTRQPRMKQEVEKRSTSGSRVVSAKDFPGGATHDDLVPYLPRSGIPSNYARPMNVCTYFSCDAVGDESQEGYCASHFVALFNTGILTIPRTPHAPFARAHNDVITTDKTNMAALKTADSPTRRQQVTPPTPVTTVSRKQSHNKSQVVSGNGGSRKNVMTSPLCISGICVNRALNDYNGLCRDCYVVLCEKKLDEDRVLEAGLKYAQQQQQRQQQRPQQQQRRSTPQYVDARDACFCDKCDVESDCDVELDGGDSYSMYKSLQPSDTGHGDSGAYTLSLGDSDFVKDTTHHTNDRG